MKVLSLDDECIILFLIDIDVDCLNDRDILEDRFRDIFSKLKDMYSIIIEGYYTIELYTDSIMGMVVVIEKEQIDYFDYFDNQVDMRIIVHDNDTILYEIDDDFTTLKNLDMDIFFYKNKFYGRIKRPLSSHEIGYLLEHSFGILYGDSIKYVTKDINYLKQ